MRSLADFGPSYADFFRHGRLANMTPFSHIVEIAGADGAALAVAPDSMRA